MLALHHCLHLDCHLTRRRPMPPSKTFLVYWEAKLEIAGLWTDAGLLCVGLFCIVLKSCQLILILTLCPAQLINQLPDIRHCDKHRQAQFSRKFALNIFAELRAEAVTVAMPALANCIFQSRYWAGLHMISSLWVILVYVADIVLNTVLQEPRIYA